MNSSAFVPSDSPRSADGSGKRSRSSGRLRSWLIFLIVLSLVGVLMVIWSFYVTVFTQDRYEQLPPGRPLPTDEGFLVKVVKITRTPVLSAGEHSAPDPAVPGSEWVIVDLEVTAPDPLPEESCTLVLIGADGREWTTASGVSTDIPIACGDLTPGQIRPSQVIYQVPSSQISNLYGISVELYDGSVDQVARPPA